MSKIIKSICVNKHTVQVRSMREYAGARAEYVIEVHHVRDHFGLEPYQAQVGYYPDTIKTKAAAFKVSDAIANGKVSYKGFIGGELSTIPQQQ